THVDDLARDSARLRSLTEDVRSCGLERVVFAPRERAPRGLLPRLAAAHRAERQLADDRHAVPALCAVELAFHRLTGSPELDVVAGCPPTRVHALRHPRPLEYLRRSLEPELSLQTPEETPDPYAESAPEEDDWLVAP